MLGALLYLAVGLEPVWEGGYRSVLAGWVQAQVPASAKINLALRALQGKDPLKTPLCMFL